LVMALRFFKEHNCSRVFLGPPGELTDEV
jgi:hypothetical protein